MDFSQPIIVRSPNNGHPHQQSHKSQTIGRPQKLNSSSSAARVQKTYGQAVSKRNPVQMAGNMILPGATSSKKRVEGSLPTIMRDQRNGNTSFKQQKQIENQETRPSVFRQGGAQRIATTVYNNEPQIIAQVAKIESGASIRNHARQLDSARHMNGNDEKVEKVARRISPRPHLDPTDLLPNHGKTLTDFAPRDLNQHNTTKPPAIHKRVLKPVKAADIVHQATRNREKDSVSLMSQESLALRNKKLQNIVVTPKDQVVTARAALKSSVTSNVNREPLIKPVIADSAENDVIISGGAELRTNSTGGLPHMQTRAQHMMKMKECSSQQSSPRKLTTQRNEQTIKSIDKPLSEINLDDIPQILESAAQTQEKKAKEQRLRSHDDSGISKSLKNQDSGIGKSLKNQPSNITHRNNPVVSTKLTNQSTLSQKQLDQQDTTPIIVNTGKNPKTIGTAPIVSTERVNQKNEQCLNQFAQMIEERRQNGKDDQPLEFKEFQVGLKIGQGAFAIVRRVVHRETKAVIALKTYDKKNLKQEEAQQSVHNEISTLSEMSHPNIMRLYEVIDQRTQVHLVMELCGGMPIFHHIKKLPNQRFPESVCKVIFRQLALGIGYMHHRGKSHRDLKLDNILYEQESQKIKIIDFGFSIPVKSAKQLNSTVCGTPHYMDPDLSRRAPYSPTAADVWALGVCLYIMFVGKLPFFAEFENDLFRKIQSGKFKPVPKDLGDNKIRKLFEGIFQTDHKKRFTADNILRHEWLQYDNSEL